MPVTETLRIRIAGPLDIHRLAALLPMGFENPMHSCYLIAEDELSGQLYGGACISRLAMPQKSVAGFQFVSLEDKNASETKTLLLRACIAQARTMGVHVLHYSAAVPEGGQMENFLANHGFTPHQVLVNYEMDVETGLCACNDVCKLLERRKRVPEGARVISFNQAPFLPVQNLVGRYLGGSLEFPGKRLLEHISTVVQLGPRVIGSIIVVDSNGKAEAPYDVVDDGFRNSWVTPFMWRRAFQEGHDAGYTRVYFKTNEEQFKNFANFSRRMKSVPSGKETRYTLKFA